MSNLKDEHTAQAIEQPKNSKAIEKQQGEIKEPSKPDTFTKRPLPPLRKAPTREDAAQKATSNFLKQATANLRKNMGYDSDIEEDDLDLDNEFGPEQKPLNEFQKLLNEFQKPLNEFQKEQISKVRGKLGEEDSDVEDSVDLDEFGPDKPTETKKFDYDVGVKATGKASNYKHVPVTSDLIRDEQMHYVNKLVKSTPQDENTTQKSKNNSSLLLKIAFACAAVSLAATLLAVLVATSVVTFGATAAVTAAIVIGASVTAGASGVAAAGAAFFTAKNNKSEAPKLTMPKDNTDEKNNDLDEEGPKSPISTR